MEEVKEIKNPLETEPHQPVDLKIFGADGSDIDG